MTVERICEFLSSFEQLQKEIHAVAQSHGFVGQEDHDFYVPTKLALIMSEATEALEAHRRGNFNQLPSELADIVIRTMNLAEALGINLAKEILDKHEYNQKRPYKHGDKRY